MSSLKARLGEMHAASFQDDPKHLGFVLARYHFVARMFQGFEFVLEVGCGDGTGAYIVQPNVDMWMGMDRVKKGKIRITEADILETVVWPPFHAFWDGIYALDVLEHIREEDENRFFKNVITPLAEYGTLIIGSPSLESQPFASELSRKEHINCKTEDGLRATLRRYFHNVYLFGMNDCTLHTGFGPLCHYRLAIATGKKSCPDNTKTSATVT